MWMVDPARMCRQHLLGEHVELHMFLGGMRKGARMDGYVVGHMLEPLAIASRHEALVHEMSLRGYEHRSPLQDYADEVIDALPDWIRLAKVPHDASLAELVGRCAECRARFAEAVRHAC
jgi:hypothetical protein